ncbi:hypothetical protein PISMIDRAFT_686377 [Pisolithus microcarpus 441]|uniref:Heterokaryon incompatibility domain-containing protein n=1 Tax=Pisolithus microcarpus 441 TaxID=765257 RepID=A0A0C9XVB1_9AGAM|nr:hypothetical protein PISMIDRAFT_686377 [Pisolithus microcarpus 441]
MTSVKDQSARDRNLFKDTIWLGGVHDGYPQVSFSEYRKLRITDEVKSDHRKLAALMQSHLTFGLLESVMRIRVPESVLLREEDGGRVIVTSDNLHQLLRDWQYRIRETGNTDYSQQWAADVQTTLTKAKRLLSFEFYGGYMSLACLPRDDFEMILFQLASIGEALTEGSHTFPASVLPRQGISWSFVAGAFDPYRRQMEEAGWCPYLVRIISERVCTLTYASTQRPFLRGGAKMHSHCTREKCAANNINSEGYINPHTTSACVCTHNRPPFPDVAGPLSHGHIPVLQWNKAHNKFLVGTSSDTPYVAISHVWADGLGSTTEVGLPMCQIDALVLVTQRFISSGAFWIDSLCVPEVRDLRKRAIGLMSKTYRDAQVTVVLDSGIRSCSISAPREEKLLRVLSSGWMQRLWTLQEALLAKKLALLFHDGVVAIDELLPTRSDFDVMDTLLISLAAEVFRLTKYRRYSFTMDDGFTVSDVITCLQHRTTSKAEDETLAVSGLLNVNPAELVNLAPQQRMRSLLLAVGKIPCGIIFLTGEKLSDSGFSWAPRTLMGHSTFFGLERNGYATPIGLHADYEAIYFRTTVIDAQRAIRLLLPEKEAYVEVNHDSDPFECNAILLPSPVVSWEFVQGVAVLVTGREASGNEGFGGDRLVCKYQKRFVLSPRSLDKEEPTGKEILRVHATSGIMRVRLV